MNKSEFLAKARERGLGRVAEAIAAAQPCIRLTTQRVDDDSITVGASKIGGDPDVPPDFEWPVWNGAGLAFLAQINLADVARMPAAEPLPRDGLLSFFFHPDQVMWFDLNEQRTWRTYYFPVNAELKRNTTPGLNSNLLDGPYPPCNVVYHPAISYPNRVTGAVELDTGEDQGLFDLHAETLGGFPRHQLLGHPWVIQVPMEFECELESNGIRLGMVNLKQHPRYNELLKGANEWRLLLQLDTDHNADMTWGDAGVLYFWIKKDALTQRRSEDTWMILQSM